MTFSTKKRFIAGATCRKCAAVDKIQVFSEQAVDYRQCINCGLKDQVHLVSAPREIQTRVNTTAEQRMGQTQKITLLDA